MIHLLPIFGNKATEIVVYYSGPSVGDDKILLRVIVSTLDTITINNITINNIQYNLFFWAGENGVVVLSINHHRGSNANQPLS